MIRSICQLSINAQPSIILFQIFQKPLPKLFFCFPHINDTSFARSYLLVVEAPRAGEVRIKMLYSAVCHTDAYTLSGAG